MRIFGNRKRWEQGRKEGRKGGCILLVVGASCRSSASSLSFLRLLLLLLSPSLSSGLTIERRGANKEILPLFVCCRLWLCYLTLWVLFAIVCCNIRVLFSAAVHKFCRTLAFVLAILLPLLCVSKLSLKVIVKFCAAAVHIYLAHT